MDGSQPDNNQPDGLPDNSEPEQRDQVPIDPDLAPSDPGEPSDAHRPSVGRHPSRARPDVLAVIAVGGAVGAAARYEMTRLIAVSRLGFPWATFWTNLSGSLVLGFVLVLIIEHLPPSHRLRPLVVVGFLGAYTTYSTYMVETALLIKDGRGVVAATYLLSSALLGFGAVWLGITGARRLTAPSTSRLR